MMQMTKADYWDQLKANIESTADWRRRLAIRFPNDRVEHTRAASILDKLASADSECIAERFWQRLLPLLDGDELYCYVESESESIRHIDEGVDTIEQLLGNIVHPFRDDVRIRCRH